MVDCVIAAVAWRPDLLAKRGKILLSVLNFLMLFGWWIFLYAFIVFPHQYVALNVAVLQLNVRLDRLSHERAMLREGQIPTQFRNTPPRRKRVAIVGGTGAYRGASGQLVLVERPNPPTSVAPRPRGIVTSSGSSRSRKRRQ